MLKTFIESHFNFLIIFAAFLGLFVPYGQQIPSWFILFLLTVTIYVSCFKLRINDLRGVKWRNALLFMLGRFLVFPLVLFYILNLLIPQYAFIGLVFGLLPAGVSSPAMAAIYGANVTLAFIAVVITTLATPFSIPGLLYLTSNQSFNFDSRALFQTLLITILAPFTAFLITRYFDSIRMAVTRHGKVVSMVSIILLGPTAIAKQQNVIIANPMLLLKLIAASSILYLVILTGSWWAGKKSTQEDRITYIVGSCFNNTGLGIGLALLHLTPEAVLFFVVCEIPWVVLPSIMTYLLSHTQQKN